MDQPLILAGLETIVIGALIGGLAASAVSYFFAPKPKGQKGEEAKGRSGNVRSAETAQHVVYGYTTKGGTLFYINGTGSDNDYLHEMLVLAGHEVEAIGDVRYNAENVEAVGDVTLPEPAGGGGFLSTVVNGLRNVINRDENSSAAHQSRIKKHLGSPTQSADSNAVSENTNWTNDHRARGQAYLYLRLNYKSSVFTSFIPNVTAEVFGRKLYDPRDSQTRWTMNPALIIADILESYLGVARENIDQTALATAADICDERVTNKDASESPRYTANGYIELDGDWEKWLTPFINAMAGAVVEWGGTYYIHAGAWTEPVLTLTDDDFMGAFTRSLSGSDRDRSNAAKGTFIGPQSYDEPTEFPIVKDAVAIGEDGGRVNWLELDLEMVNDHRQAQRVANILLQESRRDETMTVEVPLVVALDVKPWDNVRLVSNIFGFDETFRVIDHRILPGMPITAELTLKRHDPEVYDWNPATQEGDLQNAKTNLPGVGDKTVPTAATYALTPIFADDDHRAGSLSLNWTDPATSFEAIEIEAALRVESREQNTNPEPEPPEPGEEPPPEPAPVPGPWGIVAISETREIVPGVETAAFDFEDESLTDGPYDFRSHVMVVVRLRARLSAGEFGPWVYPAVE
ncbi:phage tail protein [Roseibacillus ishigakijimensis]|uniref:Tip attachment protein J domain-containing protein n=1 Tax=Roseibacillus ishigakijimensis TaxID=454146 RepID=A0A934RQA3_9BACT|nr:phage tail protein [Roseibacillus ishigakijimensis]MBK1835000.1 hypothetical protein [Roseibacillus ishigakijimensis]